jgi:phosphate transport system substrate-binding protein
MVIEKISLKACPLKWVGGLALIATLTNVSVSYVSAQSAEPIKADGSSTVFPITEKVAEGFQKSTGNRVTVAISGTGGGFKRFCVGGTDVQNASRPISEKEVTLCSDKGIKYIEIPVAYDALTVVVSPQNTWATSLTTAELKKMWEPAAKGVVMNWNQVRSGFPDKKLVLFGPGADSGTFDYFTEAINGKSKQSRPDYTGSEDDNVLVQGVSRNDAGIGYFGFAYYAANQSRLKAVAVDNGKGPVLPSEQAVLDGSYSPLSRPIFIYVNADSLKKKPEVQAFVKYYLENAASAAKAVAYVPLSAEVYSKMQARIDARQIGTAFLGRKSSGLSVKDLLTLEPKK